jgi:multicomponent Na+:H+ antiporter subunit G
MSETIGKILMAIGVLFDLFGCIGLVRLPDVYNRLQATTKCVTLGTCLILIGVAFLVPGEATFKALLCAAFILLTSPVTAHALARAAHRHGIPLWSGSVMDKYREAREQEKSPGESQ